MEVSPEAQLFSEIHPLKEIEEMREKFKETIHVEPATVSGSRETLKALQDDLRKAGYRKLV